MGNQASIAHGSRSTYAQPPHIPSQAAHTAQSKRERRPSEQESRTKVPGVPISGVRKLSGGNGTPGTYETPPCINVKVGRNSVDDSYKLKFNSRDKVPRMDVLQKGEILRLLQTKT